jgi:hypothetical protein
VPGRKETYRVYTQQVTVTAGQPRVFSRGELRIDLGDPTDTSVYRVTVTAQARADRLLRAGQAALEAEGVGGGGEARRRATGSWNLSAAGRQNMLAYLRIAAEDAEELAEALAAGAGVVAGPRQTTAAAARNVSNNSSNVTSLAGEANATGQTKVDLTGPILAEAEAFAGVILYGRANEVEDLLVIYHLRACVAFNDLLYCCLFSWFSL